MRLFLFFLFFLIFSSLAQAIDTLSVETCGYEEYPTKLESKVCQKLSSSQNFNSLSDNEKKRIIVDMLTKGDTTVYDMHSFVDNWNRMLNFTSVAPTEGPASVNDRATQNVWVRTFSIFPTYEELSTVYTPGDGTILSGYNYNIVHAPSSYYNGQMSRCSSAGLPTNPYPYAGSSNCKTNYVTRQDKSKFRVYVNGAKQKDVSGIENGTRELTDFSLSAASYTFNSELDAYYYVKTNEWTWQREGDDCCEWDCDEDGCSCVDPKYTCAEREDKYGSNTYEYHYRKTISHAFDKPVQQYSKPSYSNQITITDRNTDPVIEVDTDAPDYKLDMGDASLSQFGSGYRVDWKFPPYNSLHVVKENGSSTKFVKDVNLINNKEDRTLFSTQPKNTDSCSITYYFPLLEEESVQCSITEKYTPQLKVKTENLAYKKDEKIKVDLFLTRDENPETGNVQVSYCEETNNVQVTNGKGSTEFTANPDCEIITVKFSDSDFAAEASTQFSIRKNHALVTSMIIAFVFMIAIARFAWYTYWRESI